MKKSRIVVFTFCLLLMSCNNSNSHERISFLFPEKTSYEAAVLITDNKINRLDRFIDSHPELVSESYSGKKYYSILHESVKQNNSQVVELLLEKGFNPNVLSSYSSVLYVDCEANPIKKTSREYEETTILSLLIKYGANPDIGITRSLIYPEYNESDSQPEVSPLMILSTYPDFISVKTKMNILMNDGHADLNYKTVTGYTAAAAALEKKDSITNAHYLICECHADINTVFYDNLYYLNKKENMKSPVMLLRKLIFPLDSKEYQLKKEIINEFANQGVDYYNEPVSEETKKIIMQMFPADWEDMIQIY